MKQFIRYLYEYENEKRIRNVGFIKVETGCEETIVNLQAKGFHDGKERRLKLYLFFVENERVMGILQGEVSLTSPVLSWKKMVSADNVGGRENYEKICGILIESESGRRMAATWDDRCVDVSKLKEFKEEVDLSPVDSDCGCEKETSGQEAQEEDDYTQSKGFQFKCTKISRQELCKLPRCEWKLANNRFLMHGYNNFHHLLLIDNGNYLKLGVPGIYHIKEAKCAESFGFEEFISFEELRGNSEIPEGFEENDNQEDGEIFGYWCHSVRRGRSL